MLTSTTFEISDKKIIKTIGIARGSTIRAKHLGKDILAFFKMLRGGEIKSYTQMMAEAREESFQRMCDIAAEMGATAVVGVRFSSVMVMNGTAECLAYGTAVVTN
jgi:uncharacterized protein YbjQ (UPF0145 family)